MNVYYCEKTTQRPENKTNLMRKQKAKVSFFMKVFFISFFFMKVHYYKGKVCYTALFLEKNLGHLKMQGCIIWCFLTSLENDAKPRVLKNRRTSNFSEDSKRPNRTIDTNESYSKCVI